MWPALEHLEIQECFGLSKDNVSNFLPRFNSKLKTVVLPGGFSRLLCSLPNSSIRIGLSPSNQQECFFLKEESEDSSRDSGDDYINNYDDVAEYYDEMCESDFSFGSDYGGYF